MAHARSHFQTGLTSVRRSANSCARRPAREFESQFALALCDRLIVMRTVSHPLDTAAHAEPRGSRIADGGRNRAAFSVGTMRFGIYAGKFCAQQKHLGRVINPDQHDHQRPGRRVRRGDGRFGHVLADQELPDFEQDGGDERPCPDVSPRDRDLGHKSVDHPEKQGEYAQRNCLVDQLKKHSPARNAASQPTAQCGQHRAYDQRDEQQKRQCQNQAKGKQARADQGPYAGLLLGVDLPDAVQRAL